MTVVFAWIKITSVYVINWADTTPSYWTCLLISTSLIFVVTAAILKVANAKMIITVIVESALLTGTFLFLTSQFLSGFP